MKVDFTVVGAGIVGLATAVKLLQENPGSSLVVLEKEADVACHQTGRNSGVIHSGIYYRPGSFRARNCVDGRRQLVQFCRRHKINHTICGKVIVATEPEEIPRLNAIYRRGLENGIENLRLIDRKELNEIEPSAAGLQAIYVPSAGIVDFTEVSRVLADLLIQSGGEIVLNSKVKRIRQLDKAVEIQTSRDTIHAGTLVSCAGLYSDRVAKSAGLQLPMQIVPFRGEYYRLTEEAEPLVRGLIYPLPNPEFPFLGVHLTRMAVGGVECGPNAVFAFRREGYHKCSFDLDETIETFNWPGFWRLAGRHWKMGLEEYYRSFSKAAFLEQLKRLLPALHSSHLEPSPSGVRAMALTPEGEIFDDFHFETFGRQVHLLNAPSPAATAALSIADEIVRRVKAL